MRLLRITQLVAIAASVFDPSPRFALGDSGAPSPRADAPELRSETYVGDAQSSWYECASLGLSPKGQLIVSAVELRRVEGSKNHLWLWMMDEKGRKVSEIEVTKPTHDSSGNKLQADLSETILFDAREDGEIILVSHVVAARPWIVRLDKDGKQSLSREIVPGRRVTIARMIPTGAEHYLLLGSEGVHAVALKINLEGRVVQEYFSDRGDMEFFVDGVCDKTGSCTLMENSGQYGALGAGPSKVWVTRFDAAGGIVSEAVFEGRGGRIVRGVAGGIVLVHDNNIGFQQSIVVRGLDARFVQQWASKPMAAGRLPGRRSLCPDGDGWVVAGNRHGRPWLFKVGKTGQLVWEKSHDTIERAVDGELIVSPKHGFVMGSTVFTKTDKGYTRKVRLLQFGGDSAGGQQPNRNASTVSKVEAEHQIKKEAE